MNRRRFLAGSVTATATVLAGCGNPGGEDEEGGGGEEGEGGGEEGEEGGEGGEGGGEED